ncbi:MAG: ABC transporter ATP-binding protein [Alphaproteobacteria bacterium]|nr:ABC transporter ATP-binding protein [Alphaproteobacteria bacterium]
MASRRNKPSNFSRAPLRLIESPSTANFSEGGSPGAAEFPRRPMAFLWHYIRRRPVLHVAALAAVLGAAAFACFSQFGLKLIVDAMAGGPQHIAQVWWALAIFAGLLAAESALWRVGARLGYRAMVVDKAEVKLDLFNHLSGHCTRYFSDRLGGSLANRISGTGDAVQQVFQIGLFNLAPVVADFCAALAMLATIGWQVVVALGAFVLLSGFALARAGQRGSSRHRFHADRAAEVGGELMDVLSNIWVVRAFSARARERSRFARLLDIEKTAHRDSLMYIERIRVMHDLGLWLMAGGMLAWTLYLWSKGQVSPGDVILTVSISFRILHGSRDFAFALVNATQFIARIAESIQVIGENHSVVDRPGAGQLIRLGGRVEFTDVDFAYPGGREVFQGFSLSIEPGQRVGLVGPSGAGKSTLIGLLQRLADIDDGRILIDDQDIRGMTQDSLRAAIAVVPQDISLFHRSVLENIRYAKPEATREEVLMAALAARCDDFIRALPQGYDTVVGDRGLKLSGGQRQRIGIARALLKDAPIVVLDEATSALDTASEVEIQRALEVLMRGRTVLAIAHRLSTVSKFDRVVVLDEGRIVEDGSPAELRRRRGFFDRMCQLQEGNVVQLAS